MGKGKIIAFEGLDCCFKETQSKMLLYDLKALYQGNPTVIINDFPRYTSLTGQVIYNMLHNQYGDINKLPIQLIGDIYSIDRAIEYYTKMKQEYEEFDTIYILDRWTYSNCIYQVAREYDLNSKDPYLLTNIHNSFISYMMKEFNMYKLPRPDITFHMDMSIECMKKLLVEKKNKDINELNIDFLTKCHRVEKIFYDFMKDDNSIYHIKCDISGVPRTREDIHDGIMNIVMNLSKENN